MSVADVLAAVLLLLAVGFTLLAAIGLQRFDDVFARMHAATKAVTLGVLLACLGASFRVEDGGDIARLLLAAGLQLVTAPISSHMVGRAAYRTGTELSPATSVDELADSSLQRGDETRGGWQ
jgi:multicomponent Na+:H+ antiporter subunit G